jgi:nascent polypeptide-associated complex subunit beta
VHKSSGTDDKKLQTTLKKMNVQPIQAIEEVNMFKEDGNVIHFAAPKGKNAPPQRRKAKEDGCGVQGNDVLRLGC